MQLKDIVDKIRILYINHSRKILLVSSIILVFVIIQFIKNNRVMSISISLFSEFNNLKEKEEFQWGIIKKLNRIKDLNASIYSINEGENYWGIALKNSIDINTIIGMNPYLKNLYSAINEKIIIGNQKGCIHIVQKNENVKSIAHLYQINECTIRRMNRIGFFKELFYPLKKDDILFIPKAKPVILTKEMDELFQLRKALQSPLGGVYTSGYGVRIDPITKKKKYHNGLDIRVKIGDLVGAANDGIVIYSGWANGYGKMIKIQHDNGYTTLYGHLSRIHVKQGQRVKKGQIIARAGNTGRTTGPHLHFTVWYKGQPVNPALFLW